MRILIALIAIAAIAGSTGHAASPQHPDQVEIPQGNGALKAQVYRPEGEGPFPAVIGLHNCAGLVNRSGVRARRYHDWGQRLAQSGFVVLLPDSNGSRGLGNQCATRNRNLRADRERVADADAARQWLQRQTWVIADRISLMGWSSGAIAALWAVRARTTLQEGPDFRSAVAFYPGCRRLSASAWSARVPTLILIGSADDQASAAVCEQMVKGARGRSASVVIRVYPGAHHDFDHPGRPVHVRSGYAFSVDGSGRVHTGTNPAARADALKRVPEWLAR
jgi:dienelactone hydrolase